MKLKHIALIGSLFPILFSLVLFFGVLISADSDDENSNFSSGITGMNLSAEVLKHQPMVEKYAREYGISEYVNVLLAIIQVESGGTAEDVMQSSESLGLPPNSLDTESSIKQGCKYFVTSPANIPFIEEMIEEAERDIEACTSEHEKESKIVLKRIYTKLLCEVYKKINGGTLNGRESIH